MKQKTQDSNVAAMKRYISEVDRFVTVLKTQQGSIEKLLIEEQKAKYEFNRAKEAVSEAKESELNTISLLLKFVMPGSIDIMPLFDTMEQADDTQHGQGSDKWRKEPITALNLSALAVRSLIAADVVLVGQLQDRIKGDDWWKGIDGITDAVAQAIESKLHDFIKEQAK